MPTRALLRLGTRGSLLALAQSRAVQRALQAHDAGLQVQLVVVATRGDRNRTVPLAQVEDPGFFSAELDDALRDGTVDFCVHSLKDLPLAPRAGIHCAAIPAREDPRDVVVFRPDVMARLGRGEPLRLGSSSTRRATLVTEFLGAVLPRIGKTAPRLELHDLRGPVEQRLARVRLAPGASAALDGVVLALAGLARLWASRDGHAALAPLLAGAPLMVLPLSACPTAPGQGALSVDCRADDLHIARLLSRLHDLPTARRVTRERALLEAQPTAERGAFAATCLAHEHCGTLLFVRGRQAARPYRRLVWREPPRPRASRPWDGADWVRASAYRALANERLGSPAALFLAHWRALPPGAAVPHGTRLWVSGVESWRELARRGIWVEGCADNLGFAAVTRTLSVPVLRLPPLGRWTVLTRDDAVASWHGSGVGHVVATYAIDAPADGATLCGIRQSVSHATHFFWGSAAQYRALRAWLPPGSHHACGPGKTFRALQAEGVANLAAFPSRREWQAWLA